jgi:hypothetical protein
MSAVRTVVVSGDHDPLKLNVITTTMGSPEISALRGVFIGEN